MPIQITDHVDAGLGLLLSQYQEKPRISALLTSYLSRVQELDDVAWDVLISRLLDNATGAQLAVLGKIVGQARIEDDDESYRLRIRTRIRANQSLGHPGDIIEVALLAFDVDPTDLIHTELYPSSSVVETLVPTTPETAEIAHDFFMVAKAIGTSVTTYFSDDAEEYTFAFSDTDEDVEDEARGFGGDDPEIGPGGLLIGAF